LESFLINKKEKLVLFMLVKMGNNQSKMSLKINETIITFFPNKLSHFL